MENVILKQSENANINYLAIVSKITNVTPIPNSDKLSTTVVNGYNIIVQNTTKVGDIVVFFPQECCICEQFLKANNEYGISDYERNENAQEVKKLIDASMNETDANKAEELMQEAKSRVGFFNKYGRVTMLKLRGVYSCGFIMPIASMEKAFPELIGTNWEELVGTEFNLVNEILFTWKYIPRVKVRQPKNPDGSHRHRRLQRKMTRFDKIIPEMFARHYETEQIEKSIRDIKPDDVITVTTKLHGCVEKNTIVNTLEYGDITIGEIVEKQINCSIKSYNVKTKKMEYAPVEQFYYVPNDGEWYEIELEDGSKLTITGNNPVWIPELNCYRRVDELDGTEMLLIS